MFTWFWLSQAVVKDFVEDDAGEWRVAEWLSFVIGRADELVVDVGIGIVRTGVSLVVNITGSGLLGRGTTYCVFV